LEHTFPLPLLAIAAFSAACKPSEEKITTQQRDKKTRDALRDVLNHARRCVSDKTAP
jgi:hypothetical protein